LHLLVKLRRAMKVRKRIELSGFGLVVARTLVFLKARSLRSLTHLLLVQQTALSHLAHHALELLVCVEEHLHLRRVHTRALGDSIYAKLRQAKAKEWVSLVRRNSKARSF